MQRVNRKCLFCGDGRDGTRGAPSYLMEKIAFSGTCTNGHPWSVLIGSCIGVACGAERTMPSILDMSPTARALHRQELERVADRVRWFAGRVERGTADQEDREALVYYRQVHAVLCDLGC